MGSKNSFMNEFAHPNLVATRAEVKFSKKILTMQFLLKFMDSRDGKSIFTVILFRAL